MSLNPLSIAHLGIGRRPIVAALLGIWDELMLVLAATRLEYHGGGKRRKAEDDTQLHRDHWDYMDSLRDIQAKAAADKDRFKPAPEKAPEIVLQAAPVQVSARAMRGRVEILEHQEALPYVPGNLMVLAAMMALIDEDD